MADPTIPLSDNTPQNWISVLGIPDRPTANMALPWSGNPGAFPDEVRGEYVRAFSNPETIHAICEE